MKAAVLYSGGKDSSLVGVMLKRLGLDVEMFTANFGAGCTEVYMFMEEVEAAHKMGGMKTE